MVKFITPIDNKYDQLNSSKYLTDQEFKRYFCVMMIFLKKYLTRNIIGFISLLMTLPYLLINDWGDSISIGVIFSFRLAPLYFAVVLMAFYLKDTFYLKKKFFTFLVSLLLLCFVVSFCVEAFIYEQNEVFAGWIYHFVSILFIICVSYFLKFMKDQINNEESWYQFKSNKSEAELKLLKQQLNPHFLFNTLNSIYAKCIENRMEAGEMIIQLSDMLRFQLEHDGNEKIALMYEIAFLDNYIFFEKGRLNKYVSIKYAKNILNNNIQIAPNLLITLVENAFKHSSRLEKENRIDITINCENEVIELITRNTFIAVKENNSTKIGLQNLKKRLEYLYRGRYILNYRTEENYYYATLKINL